MARTKEVATRSTGETVSTRALLKATPQDTVELREQTILEARTKDSNRQVTAGTVLTVAGGAALGLAALPVLAEVAIATVVVGGTVYLAKGIGEKVKTWKQRRDTRNLTEFAAKAQEKRAKLEAKATDRLIAGEYDPTSGSYPLSYLKAEGTIDRSWIPGTGWIPWRRRVIVVPKDPDHRNKEGKPEPVRITYHWRGRRGAVREAVHDFADQNKFISNRDKIFGGAVPESSGLRLTVYDSRPGMHWGKPWHKLRGRKVELTGKPQPGKKHRTYYGVTRVYLAKKDNLAAVAAKRVDTTGKQPRIRRSHGWGKLK